MAEERWTAQRPGESIGRYLRRMRREREQSQTAAAHALGVSQSVLSQIELGQVLPGDDVVKPLARYLGMAVADVRRQIEYERLRSEKAALEEKLNRVDTQLTRFMRLG